MNVYDTTALWRSMKADPVLSCFDMGPFAQYVLTANGIALRLDGEDVATYTLDECQCGQGGAHTVLVSDDGLCSIHGTLGDMKDHLARRAQMLSESRFPEPRMVVHTACAAMEREDGREWSSRETLNPDGLPMWQVTCGGEPMAAFLFQFSSRDDWPSFMWDVRGMRVWHTARPSDKSLSRWVDVGSMGGAVGEVVAVLRDAASRPSASADKEKQQ